MTKSTRGMYYNKVNTNGGKNMTDNENIVKSISSGKTLTVFLDGDIDHHNAREIRGRIDTKVFIQRPDELILDLSQLHGQLWAWLDTRKIHKSRGDGDKLQSSKSDPADKANTRPCRNRTTY